MEFALGQLYRRYGDEDRACLKNKQKQKKTKLSMLLLNKAKTKRTASVTKKKLLHHCNGRPEVKRDSHLLRFFFSSWKWKETEGKEISFSWFCYITKSAFNWMFCCLQSLSCCFRTTDICVHLQLTTLMHFSVSQKLGRGQWHTHSYQVIDPWKYTLKGGERTILQLQHLKMLLTVFLCQNPPVNMNF